MVSSVLLIGSFNIDHSHYDDVIMGAMASQITSLTIVYSTVYSDADQRKHQSSASLAFVRGIQPGPVNSPHKWAVTRKMFPFDDVIMFSGEDVKIIFSVLKRVVVFRDNLFIMQFSDKYFLSDCFHSDTRISVDRWFSYEYCSPYLRNLLRAMFTLYIAFRIREFIWGNGYCLIMISCQNPCNEFCPIISFIFDCIKRSDLKKKKYQHEQHITLTTMTLQVYFSGTQRDITEKIVWHHNKYRVLLALKYF